jgi:hypothetical protein
VNSPIDSSCKPFTIVIVGHPNGPRNGPPNLPARSFALPAGAAASFHVETFSELIAVA